MTMIHNNTNENTHERNQLKVIMIITKMSGSLRARRGARRKSTWQTGAGPSELVRVDKESEGVQTWVG